jgi:hypothetical protein
MLQKQLDTIKQKPVTCLTLQFNALLPKAAAWNKTVEMEQSLDHLVENNYCRYVRFEAFTAVTMKNGVFWDVTPSGFCKNRRFGGT